MRTALTILLISLFMSAALAANPSFCGHVDFTTVSNSFLEQTLVLSDLQAQRVPRLQCGLPGEKLRLCSSCSPTSPESLYRVLRPMLGSQAHLDWHSRWHAYRALEEPMDEAEYSALAAEGFLPKELKSKDFTRLHGVTGTLAGEDFLYMHRIMIKMTQYESANQGVPCMAPWSEIPASIHDADWPVPKRFTDGAQEEKAQTELDSIRAMLSRLKKAEVMEKLSLSQLGRKIEVGFHMSLHNFYRSNPLCSHEAKAQGFKCDDLLPNQTSPLNKYFWKLHGLIDDLVGDWLKAHNMDEISKDCGERPRCYQWQGTWIGKRPS